MYITQNDTYNLIDMVLTDVTETWVHALTVRRRS
jgi:hypothetical protein